MARDRSSIAKQSRRERTPLHPKAHKIMVRRKAPPGGHTRRRRRSSQYNDQLREKQKVKRMYGLLEKQFRRIVEDAERADGITGEEILKLLERRLDNVAYRLHLSPSRRGARQLTSHGHLMVNGRRVDVPSYRVSPGDEITVREKSQNNKYFEIRKQELADTEVPDYSWLSFDKSKLEAKVTGEPNREEIDQGISEQLIVEFYSR